MLTPEIVSVIAGLLVPVITSFLKDVTWPVEAKTLLCGGVSAVFAVVSLVVAGQLTLATFGVSLPIIFATATAFYNLKFKSLNLNAALENSGVGGGNPQV